MNQWLSSLLIVTFGSTVAFSQGTTPKAKASEYPVNAKAGEIEVGAEYMVHSFGADQILLADDFLVVEIAVYPTKRTAVEVDARKFTLRLNGKKDVLLAQTPGMVAASIKYPDWQHNRRVVLGGGMGDQGIILGQPPSVERFPGDRRAERGPAPPRVPADSATGPTEPVDVAELVKKVALPEGKTNWPVSGYVFFPYRGKASKLKSVELLAGFGSAPVVLRLK
jgi:hypothetical protein